jgi:hypothetical protein
MYLLKMMNFHFIFLARGDCSDFLIDCSASLFERG